MAAEPQRSAGPLRRSRIRISALVAGLAMVIAAGGALLPGFLANSAGVAPRALTATTQPESMATVTTPPPTESPELARTADRPSRGDRPERQLLSAIELPPAIAGIPHSCSIDLPITGDLSAVEIADRAERQWGFRLTGPQWRAEEYRPVVQLFAETLDAVDCTDYLDRVKQGNGGSLEISSEPTRSWAWGDYGLTRPKVLTLDFIKFRQGYADGDRGRLVRLIIHEMAHSLNGDRYTDPAYWRTFNQVWNSTGPVSAYGKTETESFADAVGYYVARCAADNPYATAEKSAYYDYVKTNIFGGREFGGAVGTAQHCEIQGR